MVTIDDIVARFTAQAIPLSKEAAVKAIASTAQTSINVACRKSELVHHGLRKDRSKVLGGNYGGKSPADEYQYIGLDICLDNVQKHGFNTAKWCNTIRDHAKDRLSQFRAKHISWIKTSSEPKLQAELDPGLSIADTYIESDPFSDGWDAETKASFELNDISDVSSIATEISEAATVADLEIAVEAAGLVALGEVAVFVLPLLIPLFVSLFSSPGAALRQEMAAADEQHESMLRELQERIRKEEDDLVKYDKNVEEANRRHRERRKKRRDDKKRKDEDDDRQKKREDSYYACIDRIMPLDFSPPTLRTDGFDQMPNPKSLGSEEPSIYGYELRMSAIRQDGYWSSTFLGQLQEHEVGLDLLAIQGSRIYVVTMYVHSLPSGAGIGDWVEFELERRVNPAASHKFIVQSKDFTDGIAARETFEPSGLTYHMSPRFFADSNWGDIVQVELDTFKLAPQSALSALKHGINTFNPVSTQLHHGGRRLIRFPAPDAAVQAMKQSSLTAGTYDWSPQARYLYMTNCGQGAAQFILDSSLECIFAVDCGYGRGTEAIIANLSAFLKTGPYCPIVLSHWDKDHYSLATSAIARQINYTVENRKWFAPDFVTGSLALQLYAQIDRAGMLFNLLPKNNKFKFGNMQIRVCSQVSGTSPGKNNKDALAIMFGDNKLGYVLYPGDANYECIPDVNEFDQKVVIMVATHHGSIRSITNGSQVGTRIPKAMPKQKAKYVIGDNGAVNGSVCAFSYGQGNSYGHDTTRVSPYYKNKAKYTLLEKTAEMEGEGSEWHSGLLLGLANDLAETASNGKSFQLGPPTASNSRLRDASELPDRPGAFRVPAPCPDDISIKTGYGALDKYAVTDSYGTIVEYRIWAKKVTINAPIQIQCKADFSIPVIIQCSVIEIVFPETSAPSPLVEFDVANGDPWNSPAETEKKGEAGEVGYQGPYLDLRVMSNWRILQKDKVLLDTASKEKTELAPPELVLKYTGGNGADGQAGGRGKRGQDGKSGTDDSPDGSIKGKPAFPGARGGIGAVGGDAGGPGTFARSRVLGIKGNMVASDGSAQQVVVVSVRADTSGFGESGQPGKGGRGGPGGVGGIEGVKVVDGHIISRNKEMPKGIRGQAGKDGLVWQGQTPDYSKLAPLIKACETETELNDVFFEVVHVFD